MTGFALLPNLFTNSKYWRVKNLIIFNNKAQIAQIQGKWVICAQTWATIEYKKLLNFCPNLTKIRAFSADIGRAMNSSILSQLHQSPDSIIFSDVLSYIDNNYHFTPTGFQNGETYNAANQNNGSCKVFSFAKRQQLTKEQTLHLFGDYYRKDVLQNPEGTDHQNIRNFMKFGWDGIKFEGEALTEK